jgi:hypothetical protein
VTVDRLWTGKRTYWILIQLVTTLHRLLSHTEQCSQVTDFTALHPIPTSYFSNCRLKPISQSKNKIKFMLRPTAVGQSVLVSSTHLALTTGFLLLSESCGFVDVGRSLWRENESVIYNCCWSSPAQSFLGPIPAGPVTIFY